MPRDKYPYVELGEINIATQYPGASPEDVELKITNKIEKELETVDGIQSFTSLSLEGFSVIQVILGIDSSQEELDDAVRDVRDAVDRVTDLPKQVNQSPVIKEVDSALLPVIAFGLSGDENTNYKDLRAMTKVLKKKIEKIPGVHDFIQWGWRDREIQIEIDRDKAQNLQIPLQSIIQAVRARNIRQTAGSIYKDNLENEIVTVAEFKNPNEVKDVIIRTSFKGNPILLKDLATITDGWEDKDFLARINGKPTILCSISQTKNSDIFTTVAKVKQTINELVDENPNFIAHFTDDESHNVRSRLNSALHNGLAGLVLVVIVLSLVLDKRAALWVAFGIPLTFAGVFALLPLFNVDMDSIMIASLILVTGIIVDDAIVISEKIYKRFEIGEEPLQATITGVALVFKPVLTSVITTMLAFAPMFFMGGVMGKFCFVIPLAATLALGVSLLEAIIVLPCHVRYALEKSKQIEEPKKKRFMLWAQKRYQIILKYAISRRYEVTIFFITIFIGLVFTGSKAINFVLFSPHASSKIYIKVDLEEGTPLEETERKTREIDKIIESLPKNELRSYSSTIGSKREPTDKHNYFASHYAIFSINLTSINQRQRTADQIVAALSKKTSQLPWLEEAYYRIDTDGPPVGTPVNIRVIGSDDKASREQIASAIVKHLSRYTIGIHSIERNDTMTAPQIAVELDYEQIARRGITVNDVAQNLRIAYDGEIVTDIRISDEDINFVAKLDRPENAGIEYLKGVRIPNKDGRLVPLNKLAQFKERQTSATIQHYNGERMILITADIDKSKNTPLQVMKDIDNLFSYRAAKLGIELIVGGEAEETEKSLKELYASFALAFISIYLLLSILFGSLVQPLIILAALPLCTNWSNYSL